MNSQSILIYQLMKYLLVNPTDWDHIGIKKCKDPLSPLSPSLPPFLPLPLYLLTSPSLPRFPVDYLSLLSSSLQSLQH